MQDNDLMQKEKAELIDNALIQNVSGGIRWNVPCGFWGPRCQTDAGNNCVNDFCYQYIDTCHY